VMLNTPKEEIAAIEGMLNAALDAKDPKAALLDALAKIAPIMAKYLPITGEDINELPDDLDIEV